MIKKVIVSAVIAGLAVGTWIIVSSNKPGTYTELTDRGKDYWKQGKRSAAIRSFKKAIKINPDYPPPYFLLGKAYFFEKKYEAGIEKFGIFEKMMDAQLGQNPDNIDYYAARLRYIGYMYLTVARYGDAVNEYKKVISLNPDDQIAHYNLAVCYYKYFNNRSAAYNELQKVIETDKNPGLTARAKFFIEFMRKNPDPRYFEDFTFIEEDI